jgi:hypothetical protein
MPMKKRAVKKKKIPKEAEIISKAVKYRGRVVGEVFKTDARYVFRYKGKKGLARVEGETRKIGYPIDYSEINERKKYPFAMRIVSLLAIKRAFKLSDKQIADMGSWAPKHSFVTKIMLRYFASPNKIVKKLPAYWKRHYSAGSLEGELHEDERRLIVRLKNFDLPPVGCKYFEGYCLGAFSMITKFKNAKIEETKCVNKGDDYHEFLVTWAD